MEKAYQGNLALWNEWATINSKSAMYNLAGFLAGDNRLHSIELEEIGSDVAGKSMLHLQCHFGLDSLCWAKLGADVTAIDFSDEAIRLARSISQQTQIPARFIQTNLYELPDKLEGQFDIVYTSYGVLTWLHDLKRWAEIISYFLKPGGVFYIAEFHPFLLMLDDADNDQGVRLGYPYFHSEEPIICPVEGSYADREAVVRQKLAYEWSYGLGDVINSLISAGLEIQFLHEFPYTVDPMLKAMVADDQGYMRLKGFDDSVPLTFSIKAVKKTVLA